MDQIEDVTADAVTVMDFSQKIAALIIGNSATGSVSDLKFIYKEPSGRQTTLKLMKYNESIQPGETREYNIAETKILPVEYYFEYKFSGKLIKSASQKPYLLNNYFRYVLFSCDGVPSNPGDVEGWYETREIRYAEPVFSHNKIKGIKFSGFNLKEAISSELLSSFAQQSIAFLLYAADTRGIVSIFAKYTLTDGTSTSYFIGTSFENKDDVMFNFRGSPQKIKSIEFSWNYNGAASSKTFTYPEYLFFSSFCVGRDNQTGLLDIFEVASVRP
ncbi:hypothetical protein PY365_10175 [Roseiarcaceae bacterium H3SJ34-1]|uniref:hypothetical protein n=1 Tax=Terripilifer ovatus TaxID=3032367 RepID=UPI003AB92E74|nr:hypothetical protein [Roseiarcaceae bacterium H3SJ34-1]